MPIRVPKCCPISTLAMRLIYGGVRARMFRKGDAYDMATEGADCAAL